MSVENEYSPKYVELEDVPIAGPDEYDDSAKRRALFEAESTLELDVYDGQEIPSDDLISAHRAAVMNLGTHILTHSAVSPDDVTLGDMADGGSQSMDYSSKYLERYERLIERIQGTSGGASNSGHGNFSVSQNTRDADAMEGKYPFSRDDRWPNEEE